MQAFLVDQTVDYYAGTEIELPDREIDELGLTALYNILLEPLGIGLEVYNLHDNPGATVDLAREHPPKPSLLGGVYTPLNPPIICLLFRPTHYDLIYKQPAQHCVQVQLARGFGCVPFASTSPRMCFDAPFSEASNTGEDGRDFTIWHSLFASGNGLGAGNALHQLSHALKVASPTDAISAGGSRLQDRPTSPPRSDLFPESQTNCHWNIDFQPQVIENPEEHNKREKEARRRRREQQSERTKALKAKRRQEVRSCKPKGDKE